MTSRAVARRLLGPHRLPSLRRDLLLGAGYLVAACIALLFSRHENSVALSWFATALLIPRLASTRPRRWKKPLIICSLASMTASTLFGAGLAAAPLFAAALVIEATVGAALLRHCMPDGRYFDTVPRVGTFMGIAGIIGPAISAFAGAGAAVIALKLPYLRTWLDWTIGHGLGALAYMPLVILATSAGTRVRIREIGLAWNRVDWCLVALTLAIAVIVFAQNKLPLLFLSVLPLMLLTMRHGRIGASCTIVAIALIGSTLTALGTGPVALIDGAPHEKMLFFQFYLATCIVMTLTMAAELNRRRFVGHRLQASEALFRLMADRSGDILFNVSPDGIIRYVSPSVSRISQYSAEQLLGTPSIDLIWEADRDVVRQAHFDALNSADETFVFEYRAYTGDDRVIWFETHCRAMVDENGTVAGVVSAVRDVSHRKALESRLNEQARKDPLTGLANRRVFDERLKAALVSVEGHRPVGCLVVADIDHFKRINDLYGHSGGDQVLREVAAVFAASVRGTDTLCRIGGEEFGLILWNMEIDDGFALCDRVRERLARTSIDVSSSAVSVTISMGIVDLGKHVLAEDAFQAADAALYSAKNAGRNRLALAA